MLDLALLMAFMVMHEHNEARRLEGADRLMVVVWMRRCRCARRLDVRIQIDGRSRDASRR